MMVRDNELRKIKHLYTVIISTLPLEIIATLMQTPALKRLKNGMGPLITCTVSFFVEHTPARHFASMVRVASAPCIGKLRLLLDLLQKSKSTA